MRGLRNGLSSLVFTSRGRMAEKREEEEGGKGLFMSIPREIREAAGETQAYARSNKDGTPRRARRDSHAE